MDTTDYLDELEYCLTEGFSAPVITAMLRLAHDNDLHNLRVAWAVWRDEPGFIYTPGNDTENFLNAVGGVLGQTYHDDFPHFCIYCHLPNWESTMTSGVENDDDAWVCDHRCLNYYTGCQRCEGLFRSTTSISNYGDWCESCRDEYATFCEACDRYYADNDEHNHDGCGCEAPHPYFEFPANGAGTISNDERLAVKLPKGTITDEGLRLIRKHLDMVLPYSELRNMNVFSVVTEVGPLWQAKRGNFTRRLSTAFYSRYKYKLPAAVISEVGNLARAHSSESSEWCIEVTRDLNQSAEAFYHSDSCWFTEGTYARSRCALKSWGGMGLRSYASMDDSDYPSDEPTGRAWVQPLNEQLCPTHEVLLAHAYLVYNGYGALEGYMPARIIAYLAGKTYRKVMFGASPQYVNNESAYLIADEATCSETDHISLSYREHDQQDARSLGEDAA